MEIKISPSQKILSEIDQSNKENTKTAHGLWIPAEFRLTGTDLIDQAILYMCVTLNKNGFVSVTYMSDQVGLSRQSTSARVSRMVNAGLLHRDKISYKRVNITVTTQAWNQIKEIHEKRKAESQKTNCLPKPEKPKPEKPKPEKPKPEKPSEPCVKKPDAMRQDTRHDNISIRLSLVSKRDPLSRDDLLDFFSTSDLKPYFTELEIQEDIDNYLDFCSTRGQATLSGFYNKQFTRAKYKERGEILNESKLLLIDQKAEILEALLVIKENKAEELRDIAVQTMSKDDSYNHHSRQWSA